VIIMSKEWKGAAWLGAFLFICFLYSLVGGDKESAYQIVDIMLYGYIGLGALVALDVIYKRFKRLRQDDSEI